VAWLMLAAAASFHGPETRVGGPRGPAGEGGIWQRRFWEHAIRDGTDLWPDRRRPL